MASLRELLRQGRFSEIIVELYQKERRYMDELYIDADFSDIETPAGSLNVLLVNTWPEVGLLRKYWERTYGFTHWIETTDASLLMRGTYVREDAIIHDGTLYTLHQGSIKDRNRIKHYHNIPFKLYLPSDLLNMGDEHTYELEMLLLRSFQQNIDTIGHRISQYLLELFLGYSSVVRDILVASNGQLYRIIALLDRSIRDHPVEVAEVIHPAMDEIKKQACIDLPCV